MAYRSANYREILDNLHDGVYLVDKDRTITYWNPGAERLSGYGCEEILGHSCGDGLLVHTDEGGHVLCHSQCPVIKTLVDGVLREATVYLHHRDGYRVPVAVRVAPLHGPRGNVIGAVQVFSDDSARVAAEARACELGRLARLDCLTGLPNRLALEATLATRRYQAETFGWPYGAVMVDLDDFKEINDKHGHAAGDEVLKMVGQTLLNGCRPADTVGRWGGDEFLIVTAHVTEKVLGAVAGRLRALVEASNLHRDGLDVAVTASFGAALAHTGEATPDLVKRADAMLYLSKRSGRNRVEIDALAA